MPDISMCTNIGCELKLDCYRFTATPNPHRQSYCGFKPVNGGCEHFWENDNKTKDKEDGEIKNT